MQASFSIRTRYLYGIPFNNGLDNGRRQLYAGSCMHCTFAHRTITYCLDASLKFPQKFQENQIAIEARENRFLGYAWEKY